MTYDEAVKGLIFRYLSGSHLYGFATEESDFDYRGCFVAPDTDFLLGLRNVEEVNKKGEDEVIYEIKKFFRLLRDNNPNIVEALFVPEEFITYKHPTIWDKIVENRHLFISKKCRFTFLGYSFSQIKRIETHRKYILNPPDHKPTREEYGLPGHSVIPKDQRRAILTISPEFIREDIREVAKNEIRYHKAKQEWDSYWEWKKKRNPARRKLEEESGFDRKHSCHLVRLIRMGEELLMTGTMDVVRKDASEIAEIRDGKWTYEQVKVYADSAEKRFDELYQKSPLQKTADLRGIECLLKEILEEFYGISLGHEQL